MRRSILMMTLTASYVAQSSIYSAENPEYAFYASYVIIEGGQELSSSVINIVASSLRPKLGVWSQANSDENPLTDVSVVDEDHRLSEDARVHKLAVQYRKDLVQPTPAEKRELWNVARRELEAELRRVQAIGRLSKAKQLEKALDELTAQQHELDAVSEKLREELTARQADSLGSEAALAESLAEASRRQRELKLEEAGNRARREAIEARVDELRVKVKASPDEDPVVEELKKLVAIREKSRAYLRDANEVAPNAVPKAQFDEADAHVAEAMIELLKAQRESQERAGGGALRELNNELSRLMIQAAEIEGQQKELARIIAELREAVGASAQARAAAERIQQELQTVLQRRSHIDARWFEKQRERAEMPSGEISLRPLEADEDTKKANSPK